MYDAVILGGGPGGYAAALYAANFDLSVALVEKETVGGTCLVRGCIPAKTWLQAASVFRTVREAKEFGVQVAEPLFDWQAGLARKNRVVDQLVGGLGMLMKARKVDVIHGYGRLNGPGHVVVTTEEGEQTVAGRHVIVATGSVPRTLPGWEFDGEQIVSSDHALDWGANPGRVAIIGAGAIGCEFASLLADLGSEVTVLELMDQVVPGTDPQVARTFERALAGRGVTFHTGVSVGKPVRGEGGIRVPFGEEAVEVDKVLVAVGRAPLTGDVGLDTVKAELDRGFVKVDFDTYQTGEPGVFAIGDIVAGTPQLAHAGFAEGIAAISYIGTGEPHPVNYRAVPLIVYTSPELASVGLTEAEAKELGYEVETTRHTLAGVGRAIIRGETQGVVKIVNQKEGPVLGASVVGPEAGELIHELMYVVGWEALPAEAAEFIHGHPTLSEAVGETLLAAAGRPLH